MKKTVILKPGVEIRDALRKITDEIKAASLIGKIAVLQIDIGEACPKCGGVSIDSGDAWFKQYGKRYRTCIDCIYIWPEAEP